MLRPSEAIAQDMTGRIPVGTRLHEMKGLARWHRRQRLRCLADLQAAARYTTAVHLLEKADAHATAAAWCESRHAEMVLAHVIRAARNGSRLAQGLLEEDGISFE